jgi:hypothetical protein
MYCGYAFYDLAQIWQRKLNRKEHKDLEEKNPGDFIFEVFVVFVIHSPPYPKSLQVVGCGVN